ncbi:hypothetical protein A3J19_02695 [Candidatus Daviesbacteria bacterium RIFCSPLOWO2_02_FULL_41_8]|uniref:Uncharacterized protein n=2 Tax=Candidatus Daviesiibacteriota TaxID=1752718 RepID=A0A1F5NM13_9BACT|nr:MAG: hypothetical protein A2871_04230 [Candidatus Daviesbacteria bacterium RIFCSPHIGHO2_01_FULL_41_23]OGE62253.1 MAG: hypothetical protein A2967_02245 [Candidatus Daviesbacteria bacterium RIFCSPLOWO2_01_FULL_41_32]OGE78668.1 MAG: hypothetical protein A3J19_02695 [Candidatus Daviesbacteria bacterium RIFCSPLOWO2_02_FULL_41_8]
MTKIALKLPGPSNSIDSPQTIQGKFPDLGSLFSGILNIIFYLALFLAFYFLVWGAFSYVMARGQKEGLAKARARITWAIIGMIVTILAFFIAKFVSEAFPPGTGGLPF